jgi:hypothetical protein
VQRRGDIQEVLLSIISANLVQYYFGHPFMEGTQLRFRHSPFFAGMSGVDYGLFGYIWMKARFQPQLGLQIDPGMVVIMVIYLFLCMTPLAEHIISRVANGDSRRRLARRHVAWFSPDPVECEILRMNRRASGRERHRRQERHQRHVIARLVEPAEAKTAEQQQRRHHQKKRP